MGDLSVVSAAEMAARLESYELEQALKRAADAEAEAEKLRETLRQKEVAHVDEVSALKRSGADPVATAVAMLQAYPGLAERAADLEAAADRLLSERDAERDAVRVLNDEMERLADAARMVAAQRDSLAGKVKTVERELELAQKDRRMAQLEVKELRALNPQRMQKNLKSAQQRVRELQEVVARNKKVVSDLSAENRVLKRQVASLDTRVEALDVALDKSCEMIDSGQSIPPVWDGGEWCIYGMSGEQMRLVIEHESGASLVFDSRLGCIGAPAAPAFVVEEAAAILERHRENQAIIDASKGKRGAA